MWADTMRTLAIITVATLLSIGIGVLIGIAMARSDRVQAIVAILDIMQTMPAFVYLIPVIMPGSVPTFLPSGLCHSAGYQINEPRHPPRRQRCR